MSEGVIILEEFSLDFREAGGGGEEDELGENGEIPLPIIGSGERRWRGVSHVLEARPDLGSSKL